MFSFTDNTQIEKCPIFSGKKLHPSPNKVPFLSMREV
jgi:hypothetical protein